jgi:hypothetical protein
VKKHPFGIYKVWQVWKLRLKVELDFRMVEVGIRLGYDTLADVTYFYFGASLGPLSLWLAADLSSDRF